jgi:hypothetical protein
MASGVPGILPRWLRIPLLLAKMVSSAFGDTAMPFRLLRVRQVEAH